MKSDLVSPFYYRFLAIIIAFFYGLFFVYLIPMEAISDRENYLNYATSSDIIALANLSKGIISFISNEPIWLAINIVLSFFLEPKQIVLFVIYFSSFISSYLILKVNSKYFIFLLFLLFFPEVISKYVVHLRQGLGITIFLLAWFSISKRFRLFLFCLTPFIHASFFFVLLLLLITSVLRKIKFAVDLRTVIVVFLGIIVSFSLSQVSSLLGARQAENYDFSVASVSGLGFIFWLGIFVLYWFEGRNFTRENAFVMAALTFYLTTYFLIEVTGRIFQSTVIIVMLASLGLTFWRKKVFIFIIILFFLLSWLIRFNKPFLGWGG